MDSRVTVRFYSVAPLEAGQLSFEAALKKLMSQGDNPARDLDDEITIQASNLGHDGDRFSGDLVRFQSTNFPSLIPTKGKPPKKLALKRGAGLGHHTAFIYDSSIKILAYQITKNSVSLSLFNHYVTKACGCGFFGFYPVIKQSELKLLSSLNAKTMLIKVADPAKLEAVEDDEKKLRQSLLNLRSLADGVYVRVQVGLGNKRGYLDRSKLTNIISWLLEQRDKKKGAVRIIQVVGKDADQDEVPLDFIRWQLGGSEALSGLGQAGSDENYKKRFAFVESCLDKHMDELRNFKPGAGR